MMMTAHPSRALFSHIRALAVALVVLGAACMAHAASAHAAFGIAGFDGQVTRDASGAPQAQAGAHPYEASTTITFNSHTSGFFTVLPDTDVEHIRVDLPAGFIGDPSATPVRCTEAQLMNATCPASSQVGITALTLGSFFPVQVYGNVYNMEPPPGSPASFAFLALGVPVHLNARVRTEGDYGVTVDVNHVNQGVPLLKSSLTLWGVPADPSHDPYRGSCLSQDFGTSLGNCPTDAPRKPFLTNPTDCSTGPVRTHLWVRSWTGETDTSFFDTHLPPPNQATLVGPEGCELLDFDPSLTMRPTTSAAGSPSGYTVDLNLPQNDNPDGLAEAHLKKAVVTLPAGVTISPSAADGLQGCSDSQIALKSSGDPACPDASKIGSVQIKTPLLSDPMDGDVYLGTQVSDDPASGKMYRIFLVAKGPGVLVKLPGSIVPDPNTGQLTATFDNNPQLPFSSLHLEFKGGPRAALVNPTTCGTKTTTAELSSWSGKTVTSSSSFEITGCGDANTFAPGFTAGSANPAAGRFSPFVVGFTRSDADKEFQGLTVKLPRGLLAKVKGVPLCPDAQAAAGTCDPASRVGSATVGAGPGASPFFLTNQPVYLTGPYKGGPYGLAVVIRAVAGPFDLGTVVVRQSVRVDPNDASLTVVSDPFPTILKGVPLKIRRVDVNVDRPGFTTTPTSCAAQQVTGTLSAVDGTTAAVASRYQAADCASLPFRPKMAMRLTNKSQTTDGKHPGLDVLVTQGAGQANLKKAVVALPLSLALDPANSQSDALCSFTDGLNVRCPVSSEIGTAEAVSPLLNKPLYGKVYLVKGLRLNKKGQLIRTLPTLLIPLRGEINLDLRATSEVDSEGRLVTTFANIPDAALSGFRLQLRGGKKGILVVTGKQNLCRGKQVADVQTDGQNGKARDFAVTMQTPCANAKAVKHARKKR